MTDAQPQNNNDEDVVVECELEAAPEKVWRALTVPELVATWLDVPAHQGGGFNNDGPAYRIVEALPYSRVRYAWSDAATTELESFVTFDLCPNGDGGTSFRLTHSAERTVVAPANSNSPPLMCRAA
ncbi:SRPBCC domain-containing protein [Aminobacter sp. AP02]|uniref:SRPBCC family protein n=1 Tax=Aminobacter sp. AP02 TaxID=2135737 RepID=UPI000D6C23D7|nr:SRPBCC domain-containing protein [Aminobacter sp. AP02]PWK69871.1 uncharacterized protein YndB with AHSA1/START domain [Aminobacter sp. AP02]